MSKCPYMTTVAGNIVGDNQNSLSAGPRGPVLMPDYHLMEGWRTSTASAFPSAGWRMARARAPTANSR